jgi:hypothetical protein
LTTRRGQRITRAIGQLASSWDSRRDVHYNALNFGRGRQKNTRLRKDFEDWIFEQGNSPCYDAITVQAGKPMTVKEMDSPW